MTYSDFLRALSPYNYGEIYDQEETEKYIKDHTPRILKRVDVDVDGHISFTEFFFFIVLLQVPPVKLRRAFKKYDGKMNKEQTSIELRAIRKSTRSGQKQKDRVALDARQIKCTDEDFMKTNKAIVNQLFGVKEFITFEDI